jgi:hypothetical protein
MPSLATKERAPASLKAFTIEYLSSTHRGIIMHAEIYEATSVMKALAQAKINFRDKAAMYAARGYRVKDGEGAYHGSGETEGGD